MENEVREFEGQEQEGQEEFDLNEETMMTPEEMAQFKELQNKLKAFKKNTQKYKDQLFNEVTNDFFDTFSDFANNTVTLSMKTPYSDGNYYAATLTIESDKDDENDSDPNDVIHTLMDKYINKIEQLKGTNESLRISGQFDEDTKGYWLFRKIKKQ